MQTLEDVLGSRVNLAVLRYLSAVSGGQSGNEIAKRLGLQQSSVRLALERLVEAGVVIRNDIGRSAAYKVDQRLAFVRTVLVPLFRAEAKLRDRLLSSIARDSRRLKPKPHAVVVSAVDHSLAAKYLEKALRFKTDAEKMAQLMDEFSGNGVAVLCVHAAIAYGDAIGILAAGKKSKSGDHRDAAAFLASVIPIRTTEDKAALRAFQAILNRKDEVSYADDILDASEAEALLERLGKFAHWAEKTFKDIQRRVSR